jgi:hypothetical protein
MEEIIEEASLPEAPVVEPTHGDMYLRFPDEPTAFAALYKPAMQTSNERLGHCLSLGRWPCRADRVDSPCSNHDGVRYG